MKKLFIIGNGFDQAHGLSTSYNDFRQYLISTYYSNSTDDECFCWGNIPELRSGKDVEEFFDDKEVIQFLMYTIDDTAQDKWGDIESALGRLNFDSAFSELPQVFDLDGDRNLFKEAYQNEDASYAIMKSFIIILDYFNEWINSIDLSNVHLKPSISALFNPSNDLFLSFNYRETLEKIYRIPSVCHIHGKIDSKLVFGHTYDPLFDNDRFSKFWGSENNLEKLHSLLRKNTSDALENNISFFNALNDQIDQVYVFGFSFSECDTAYIKEIMKHINSNVPCFLHDHDSSQKKRIEKMLAEYGTPGRYTFIKPS